MSLAELQRRFFRAVTGEASWPLRGLDVYAGMYLQRFVDALAQDFPKTRVLLGDEVFGAEVARFVRAQPSTTPSLSGRGEKFAEHLRGRPELRPDAADLAALEWARASALIAPSDEVVTAAQASALGESLGEATLGLVRSARVLELAFDIQPLWLADEPSKGPVAPPRATHLIVWRKGFDVFHTEVSGHEACALRLAQTARPLAEILEPFTTVPDPATTAFKTLASWLNEGLVATLRTA